MISTVFTNAAGAIYAIKAATGQVLTITQKKNITVAGNVRLNPAYKGVFLNR